MKINISINAGRTVYIYEIDTDVLTLCATQPDKFKMKWETVKTEICKGKRKGKSR